MCLAKAYLSGNGEQEILLEDVTRIEMDDATLRLCTLFGEEKQIAGVIKAVDFQDASVVVEIPR